MTIINKQITLKTVYMLITPNLHYMVTIYRYTDCHNVTYRTQTERDDWNISMSLQTPAVNFTVKNETVSMMQCRAICTYVFI